MKLTLRPTTLGSVMFFIFLFAVINSCKKMADSSSTVIEQSATMQKAIKVENGILVFPSVDTFSKTLSRLAELPDAQKDQWETTLGFKSARRKYDEISNHLSTALNEEEGNKLISNYKEYIIIENDTLKPITGNPYFASVVNEKGIVRIGPDFYRFNNNHETIVLNGSVAKVLAASESKIQDKEAGIIQYNPSNTQTNARILQGQPCNAGVLSGCRVETSNRKSFHDFEFTRYLGIERDPYTYLPVSWIEQTSVQIHFSGQKRVLGTWHNYNTSFTCNTLIYNDNEGTDINLTNYSSPGEFKDWYVYLNSDQYVEPYQNPEPYHCGPYINTFECNATSNGVTPNNCTFTY